MKLRNAALLCLSALVVMGSVPMAMADTNILTENFNGYANQSAFEAVWRPKDGSGKNTIATQGLLIPDPGLAIDPPNDNPPGIDGKAVNILDNINEYDPDDDFLTPSFEVVPSSTQ
ncbi:MAG: hypothetical protein RID07_03370, partial [Lacipirellulaceae bacterium]